MNFRGPGILAGSVINQPALNIDIAATILDIAGLSIPDYFDGASFLDLVTGASSTWRTNFLLEFWGEAGVHLEENCNLATSKYKNVDGAVIKCCALSVDVPGTCPASATVNSDCTPTKLSSCKTTNGELRMSCIWLRIGVVTLIGGWVEIRGDT